MDKPAFCLRSTESPALGEGADRRVLEFGPTPWATLRGPVEHCGPRTAGARLSAANRGACPSERRHASGPGRRAVERGEHGGASH